MNTFLLAATAIVFGYLGGKLAQRIGLPAVVGYLIAGLSCGPSLLNLFTAQRLEDFGLVTGLALSLVAFIIGSEMRLSTLRELGSGIGIITVLESFGAFVLVAAGLYLLTGKLFLALVFGAMAPASAPAGTVAVLQECKAKGKLTNALYAVVGLDDGLAIMIFALAMAVAEMLLKHTQISFLSLIRGPMLEIVGSIGLGVGTGAAAGFFTRRLVREDIVLAVTLGCILICTGIAERFGLSLILANLALGMTYVNLFPVPNKRAYKAIESITLPVYIIFFFTAGAHLQLGLLPSMGLIGLVYIVCRIGGLTGGAWLGAALSKQSRVVRRYLGLGILSQAGVAIGLSILASTQLRSLGDEGSRLAIAVVNTIAATTIVFEIIGPIATRFAVTRAGEAGVNVTERDLIAERTVGDVMDTRAPVVSAANTLSEVIRLVSNTDNHYYPVVDQSNKLAGTITLDGIRKTFATHELNDWLVALDIAEPVATTLTADMPLSDAFDHMKKLNLGYAPVVSARDSHTFAAALDAQAVHRHLAAEVLERQKQIELAS
jgi:Kef-type K+ transport system membrane component KefB/predicted transcriptional regulator